MDASPKRSAKTAPFIFIGIFLSLMLLVSSLPAQWDVVYASHCGVGIGVGTGTGTAGTGTSVGTATGTGTGATASKFVVTVSASPPSLTAGASSTITATVMLSGQPVANAEVHFRSDLGTITAGTTSAAAPTPVGTTTNSLGVATASLTHNAAGTANVEAVLKSNTLNVLACPETAVTFTAVPVSGGGGGSSTVTTPPVTAPPEAAPGSTQPGAVGQPPASAPLPPGGGNVDAGGGAGVDGGVTVAVPPAAFGAAQAVNLNISMIAAPPPGVSPPGGSSFLPLTIDVNARSLGRQFSLAQAGPDADAVVLEEPLELRVNLTVQQLSGYNVGDVIGALVTDDGAVEPMPTQVVDLSQLVVSFSTHHLSKFTLFAAFRPGPVLTEPPHQAQLTTLGTTLSWTNPPGTTWFEVKITPFNFDGPGINLIIGDPAMVSAAQYQIKQPDFGGADPSYVILPGMTYAWHVRTASTFGEPSGPDWASWSNPRFFATAARTSAGISRAAPEAGATVESLTPTLAWDNADRDVFYYEVQVSKDPGFGSTAGSPQLYWELRHGGVTTPANSYTVPSQFPLEAGTTYHWRVRPRIQGDGKPVAWSTAFSFMTP